MRHNVEQMTAIVYNTVEQMAGAIDQKAKAVALNGGGVLIIAPNGDHVHVVVQSVHFVPGAELPF